MHHQIATCCIVEPPRCSTKGGCNRRILSLDWIGTGGITDDVSHENCKADLQMSNKHGFCEILTAEILSTAGRPGDFQSQGTHEGGPRDGDQTHLPEGKGWKILEDLGNNSPVGGPVFRHHGGSSPHLHGSSFASRNSEDKISSVLPCLENISHRLPSKTMGFYPNKK